MDHTVKVLDHGLARLVSYTQPAVQATHIHRLAADGGDIFRDELLHADYSDWTGDLEVIRNARVSYDAAWRAGEDDDKDAKLVNYLLKNRHTSPFEAMVFTFEIKAPIFVLRQWHRHRTWSYNEVSARYAELPEEFYVPAPEQITTQSTSNKQMRTTEQHPHAALYAENMRVQCEDAFRTYKIMLESGVPRELARTVLPVATYSHMFATVDLHNLFHFCALRMHAHAQYEIRVYAEAMLKLIEPICPVAVAAFRTHVLKEDAPVPVVVENKTGRDIEIKIEATPGTDPTKRTVIGVGGNTRRHF